MREGSSSDSYLAPLGVLGQRVVVLVEERVGEDLYLGAREGGVSDHTHQFSHVYATSVTRC